MNTCRGDVNGAGKWVEIERCAECGHIDLGNRGASTGQVCCECGSYDKKESVVARPIYKPTSCIQNIFLEMGPDYLAEWDVKQTLRR